MSWAVALARPHFARQDTVTDAWTPPSLAKLAVDTEGTVRVAYEDRVAEPARIRVARLDGRAGLVPVRGGGDGHTPMLAATAAGIVVVRLDESAVRHQRIGR